MGRIFLHKKKSIKLNCLLCLFENGKLDCNKVPKAKSNTYFIHFFASESLLRCQLLSQDAYIIYPWHLEMSNLSRHFVAIFKNENCCFSENESLDSAFATKIFEFLCRHRLKFLPFRKWKPCHYFCWSGVCSLSVNFKTQTKAAKTSHKKLKMLMKPTRPTYLQSVHPLLQKVPIKFLSGANFGCKEFSSPWLAYAGLLATWYVAKFYN